MSDPVALAIVSGGFGILGTLLAWLIKRTGTVNERVRRVGGRVRRVEKGQATLTDGVAEVHRQVNSNLELSNAYGEQLAALLRHNGIDVPLRPKPASGAAST